MYQRKTRFFCVLLSLVLLLSTAAYLPAAAAETGVCSDYAQMDTSNDQDYYTFASPVSQYLVATSDGWMRVSGGEQTGVEYYSDTFRLVSKRKLPKELPLFGGFFATDDNYYLLTGQLNPNQSNSTEVFRVTKYDHSWKRLGSAGLFGANTTVPFRAGSARFAQCGNYLLVRTSHEMYRSSDGYNHQANVTMEVDCRTMTVTDAYYEVMNSSIGYVSHSFNQFIRVENNRIVAVDHGDAHPRSIALLQYQTDCSTGSFVPYYYGDDCLVYPMLPISGTAGDNYTGASVGGFEISDSSYLVAGNTVASASTRSSTRNVFVSVLSKSGGNPTVRRITNYPEGEPGASTPHLVAVGANRYALLWARENMVYYVFLNGKGETDSPVYSLRGSLSDCVPVVKNNALVWYNVLYGNITFYQIPLSRPDATAQTTVNVDHVWQTKSMKASGEAVVQCKTCGAEQRGIVPTEMEVYWAVGDGWYSMRYQSERFEKEDYSFYVSFEAGAGEVDYEAYKVTSSNEAVVSVDQSNETLRFLKAGTATVTFESAVRPDLKQTFRFNVSHDLQPSVTRKATLTQDGAISAVCRICGQTVTRTIPRPKTIKLSKTKYTYTGKEIRPAVSVLDTNGKPIAADQYTVSYQNNRTSGKATVVVTFRGNYAGAKTLSFKIVPKKVTGVKVQSAAKKKVKITFSAAEENAGYQIYYSTAKDGTFQKLKSTKKTAYTFKDFVSGKKYYFKVRAYKKIDGTTYYGAFSTVRGVKVK